MQIISALADIPTQLPRPIVTMGNFDGVHFGHQTIFRLVQARAQEIDGTAIVITFDPHPQKILAPDKEFMLINHMREKIEIIRAHGIAVLICLPFTKAFAMQAPKTFVEEFLVNRLHVHEMYIGANSRFGQKQGGTPQNLALWGQEFSFQVISVPPVTLDGGIVSSTRIRQLLKAGAVAEAARLLNRPYTIDGLVVPGLQRGSTLLGYPTANVDVRQELIPHKGVYLCQVVWKAQNFPGVVNIGTNPTFQQEERLTIEVHLLDFQQTLYGEHLTIIFHQRLRDEFRFPNSDELAQRIAQDVQQARDYFYTATSSVVVSAT
jgi:riboflavin kinase / FMN adenylyltransferase